MIAAIGKPLTHQRSNVVRFGDLHKACIADATRPVIEENSSSPHITKQNFFEDGEDDEVFRKGDCHLSHS